MYNKKKPAVWAVLSLMLLCAGCGAKEKSVSVTPAPVPEETAAPSPAAVSAAASTPVPQPKTIGVITTLSKLVYFTNDTGKDLTELYLRVYGGGEWGENLIPAGETINDSEKVQLYFMPQSAAEGDTWYDLRFSDGAGTEGEITGVRMERMSSALLKMEEGGPYLIYMDAVEQRQKDTRTEEKPELSEDYYAETDFDAMDFGDGAPYMAPDESLNDSNEPQYPPENEEYVEDQMELFDDGSASAEVPEDPAAQE